MNAVIYFIGYVVACAGALFQEGIEVMKLSIKQDHQKRVMATQHINTAQDRKEQERKMREGHAKIVTDADVMAYMRRMGYINDQGKIT